VFILSQKAKNTADSVAQHRQDLYDPVRTQKVKGSMNFWQLARMLVKPFSYSSCQEMWEIKT
jgi:hypothetical protein